MSCVGNCDHASIQTKRAKDNSGNMVENGGAKNKDVIATSES